MENLGPDEKNNIEKIDDILRLLLLNIRGLHPPIRQQTLNLIADYVNNFFNEFEFLSPEQTSQIDPKIHNAENIGGNFVIEGLSFAILRKQTQVVYKYADIITGL